MRLFHSVKSNINAGIAIRNDGLGYIELDENGEDIERFTVPLEEGCMINNSMKNFQLLENGFKQLIKEVGKISVPVVIGIPSGDVIIRPMNFPKMNLEDIKSSLSLNLEENFPFSSSEAIFDAIIIETPNSHRIVDNVSVLVAAVRKSYIDQLIELATNLGITIKAIEPVNFAMLRAINEVSEGLCIFADQHNIVTTWEGHGIFFRTADNSNSFSDIRNTLQFVETQFKRVRVSKLILADVNLNITSGTDLEIVNFSSKFYKARGLAMRDPDDDYLMDLRPPEYVEFERRKNTTNPTRIALILLIIGFVILSLGTIIFAISRARTLTSSINHNREVISELQAQKAELIKNNSILSQNRVQTEQVLNFLRGDIPVLEILNSLESNAGTGIKLNNADFAAGESSFVVNISGTASDSQSLESLSEGLKQSGLFESVIIPGTTQAKNLINFTLILTAKGDLYNAK